VNYKKILTIYLLYIVAILSTYSYQLQSDNFYQGWLPLSISFNDVFSWLIGLPTIVYMSSRINGKPSDFFILFLCNITILSFLLLHSAFGPLSPGYFILYTGALFLPFFLLRILRNSIIIHIIKLPKLEVSFVDFFLVFVYLGTALIFYINAPISAGFGVDNLFLRRLEAREIFISSSLISYALAICMNGITPFLAFRAGCGERWWLVLIAFSGALFFFWLVGVRAPFAYVALAFILGWLVKTNLFRLVLPFFLISVLCVWLFILLEWWIFGGYSIVCDYFFRRLFSVQATDQLYYLQFLIGEKVNDWSWMTGFIDTNISITYYIGEHFVGNPNANSNSNALVVAFSEKGLIGYIQAVSFIAIIFTILDRLWESTHNPSFLFLGFLYGLLITEQAYTVAFVSSGVGILLFLVLFEASNSVDKTEIVNVKKKKSNI
jgi:hypothetical protein